MRRRDTQSAHAWWRQGHGSCRHGRSIVGARARQGPRGGIIPPNHTRDSRRLSLYFLLQRAPRDLRVLGSGHQSREVYMPFTLAADLARLQHYLSRSRGHSSSRVVCPRQLPLNTTRVARASNDPAPMARLCSRNRSARMPRIITGWKWSSVCGVQQNTHNEPQHPSAVTRSARRLSHLEATSELRHCSHGLMDARHALLAHLVRNVAWPTHLCSDG